MKLLNLFNNGKIITSEDLQLFIQKNIKKLFFYASYLLYDYCFFP